MTEVQKKQILEMRAQGRSFTVIAEALGVSRNSAKSYCQREAHKSTHNQTLCANCGATLIQEPRKRTRRFCCEKCRYAYWNTHHSEKRKKQSHTQKCIHCGKEFECYASANRKYCGVDCFNNARWGDTAHEQKSD